VLLVQSKAKIWRLGVSRTIDTVETFGGVGTETQGFCNNVNDGECKVDSLNQVSLNVF
jgi:hypothetical protein